jgi:hypothetical protein
VDVALAHEISDSCGDFRIEPSRRLSANDLAKRMDFRDAPVNHDASRPQRIEHRPLPVGRGVAVKFEKVGHRALASRALAWPNSADGELNSNPLELRRLSLSRLGTMSLQNLQLHVNSETT